MNARAAAQVAYSAGELPPVSTGRWALVAGVAGVSANLLLVLFFALAQPWRWPDSDLAWLGPANDVMVVVQFVALVPVAVAVRERLGAARLVGTATAAAVVAMLAVVVLQLSLLAGVLPFDMQAPLVTGCLPVIFAWLLVISRSGALPAGLARFGVTVAASFLIGMGIAVIALVLPSGSAIQYAGFGLAVAIGLPGWLGFPVWPLLAARHLLGEEET